MDAILVHVALMNIKAVGRGRWAGLMRSSDQGSLGAISRRQTSKAIPRSWRARDGTYHGRLQLDFLSLAEPNHLLWREPARAAANFAEALDSAQCPIEKS